MTSNTEKKHYEFSRAALSELHKKLITLQTNTKAAEPEIRQALQGNALTEAAEIVLDEKNKKIQDIAAKLESLLFEIDEFNNELTDKQKDSAFYKNTFIIEEKIEKLISDLAELSIDSEKNIQENINQLNLILKNYYFLKTIHYGESFVTKTTERIGQLKNLVEKISLAKVYYNYVSQLGKTMNFLEHTVPAAFWFFTTVQSFFNLSSRIVQKKQAKKITQQAEALKQETSVILLRKSVAAKSIISILNGLTFIAFAGAASSPIGLGFIALNGIVKWYDETLDIWHKADQEVRLAQEKVNLLEKNAGNLTPAQQMELQESQAAELKEAKEQLVITIKQAAATKTTAYWQLASVLGSGLPLLAPIPFAGTILKFMGYGLMGTSGAKLFYDANKDKIFSYFSSTKNPKENTKEKPSETPEELRTHTKLFRELNIQQANSRNPSDLSKEKMSHNPLFKTPQDLKNSPQSENSESSGLRKRET